MTCQCSSLLFNGDRVITLQLYIVCFGTVHPSSHRYVCFQQQCIRNTLGFATWKRGTVAMTALSFSGRTKYAKGWKWLIKDKFKHISAFLWMNMGTVCNSLFTLYFGAVSLRSLQSFLGWKLQLKDSSRGPMALVFSWHTEAATVTWD